MKYIIPGLMALLIGIAIMLPGTAPARAESDNVTPVEPAGIPVLMIKVANTIPAGQPATITVISRRSNETVAGAPVYAIKTGGGVGPAGSDNKTTHDGEMEDSEESDGSQFEAMSASEGILIGTTGGNGTLSATLAGPGRYLIIATKDGHIPGFTWLQVKGTGSQAKLNIKVVFNAIAGQPAGIQVTQKGNGQPAENATVYALKVENNKDLKQMPPKANSGKAVTGLAGNDADRVREQGVLVGSTDSTGQVPYSFPAPGQYTLAAFKEGFAPAVTGARYLLPVTKKALYLEAPAEANAGDDVALKVYSDNGTAVGRAAIFSVRLDGIKEGPSLLKSLPTMTSAAMEKYIPQLKDKGQLAGYTDESGLATLKFARAGSMLLLAVKEGFVPDFARINILQAATLTPVPVPQEVTAQPVKAPPKQVTQSHGNGGGQSHGIENEVD
jgi:hypothetical protein